MKIRVLVITYKYILKKNSNLLNSRFPVFIQTNSVIENLNFQHKAYFIFIKYVFKLFSE